MTETEKHIAELEREATLGLGLDHETSDAAIAALRAAERIRELMTRTHGVGSSVWTKDVLELLP